MIYLLVIDFIFFRSTITREKFEEICGDLWDRALDPLKEVIKHSNLTIEEIHAVELIGGATRVPKLQVIVRLKIYLFIFIYLTQYILIYHDVFHQER